MRTVERRQVRMPDRLWMEAPGLTEDECAQMARDAVAIAKRIAPKLSGASSRRFEPVWGPGWFGIHWLDAYVWFIEKGTRAHTMRSLAGKTIPMWLDDPTGKIRRENPKAKTRRTASGKMQVLIFRRAAPIGKRRPDGKPASYPGAPGRIALREAPQPWTRQGKVAGRIFPTNVGVRWRHPGLVGRNFLHRALILAAYRSGVPEGMVHTSTAVG